MIMLLYSSASFINENFCFLNQGSSYMYKSLLRPYVSRHETDIDRKLLEFRARAQDLAIFYWKNCTEMGQETFFQMLKFLTAQSAKVSNNSSSKVEFQPPILFEFSFSFLPLDKLTMKSIVTLKYCHIAKLLNVRQ